MFFVRLVSPLVSLAIVASLVGSIGCSDGQHPTPQIQPTDAGVDATVPAQDPTGWDSVGPLTHGRALATTTLLADGRVLVVGGEDTDYAMLASVEIFDPSTNTFQDAAPLPAPRDHHTATLLQSGEVLVTGGGQGSEISVPTGDKTLASALLYDPKKNEWREVGSMSSSRAGHRAALLDDGRVLVVGGGAVVGYSCAQIHPNCTIATSLGSAEIYDPATGTWSPTGSLSQPRLAFSLNLTPAGVVASGGAAENHGLESVEIFDPAANAWHPGPKLNGQRLYHSAALLGERLVVAGGKIANVAPITSVDVLDPSASKWTAGASLDEARTGASFVALQSGNGLIVAGNDQIGKVPFIAQASIYDPTNDAWTAIEPLQQGRYSQGSVLLADGSVLVIGGRTASGVTTSADRSH